LAFVLTTTPTAMGWLTNQDGRAALYMYIIIVNMLRQHLDTILILLVHYNTITIFVDRHYPIYPPGWHLYHVITYRLRSLHPPSIIIAFTIDTSVVILYQLCKRRCSECVWCKRGRIMEDKLYIYYVCRIATTAYAENRRAQPVYYVCIVFQISRIYWPGCRKRL